MISQLLFGDVFEILEKTAENWIYVRCAYDDYEGYIDPKQQLKISEEQYQILKTSNYTNNDITKVNSKFGLQLLPPACSFLSSEMEVKDVLFSPETELKEVTSLSNKDIEGIAKSYLNAPYLWGGKTPFGIDCSGFTQMVYKMVGIKLFRDASQQATQGEVLNFLEEAEVGDLAFFDNEEGNIIHVGIVISPNEIIHASGQVRIDTLDHQGIYNKDLGKYTHQLRLLKSYV